MAGLEDAINNLLSSPEQMEQFSQMAKSIMGSGVLGDLPGSAPAPPPEPPAPPTPEAGSLPDLSSLLGNIDPNMISGLMGAMSGKAAQTQSPDTGGLGSLFGGIDSKLLASLGGILAKSNTANSKKPLLEAMMVYMSPERRDKLARAMQLAKLAGIAKVFLGTLGGDGDV